MKFTSIIVILLLFITIPTCKRSESDNIFLITLDTTRADFINYSLGFNSTTPNISKLASKGFYFNNAYSVIPITLPSHASMFYSQYPHNIRILNNGQLNREKHLSLVQILRRNGFSTGAVISLGVLKSDFGLDRGFDKYYDSFKKYIWTKNAEDVNREAVKLIKMRKKGKNFFWIHYSDPHEPYFPPYVKGTFSLDLDGKNLTGTKAILSSYIKTTFMIPPGRSRLNFITSIPIKSRRHPFYEIEYISYRDFIIKAKNRNKVEIKIPLSWKTGSKKTEFRSRELNSGIELINHDKNNITVNISFLYTMHESNKFRKDLYEKSVTYMDKKLGELIEFLKSEDLFEKSVFVIMGDHGEGLGEYLDNWGHIHYLNKLYTRVPFIVSGSGIKREGKRGELVSNLNIAPTILDIAGIRRPGFMEGRSVLQPIKRKQLILETFSPEAYFDAYSLIKFPYQIIFYPGRRENRVEFTNLINDPLGIRGIIEPGIEKIRDKMLKSILNISRTIIATKGKPGKRKRIHEEILKSLGYL